MTKHRWEGSMRSLQKHIAPEKEEQMKWVKIGKYSTQEQHEYLQFNWRMSGFTALNPKETRFKARLPAPYCYHECKHLWYTEWQLTQKIKNKVKKILKLAKNINPGNKDGNLKKKAELINMVEDFHQHYDSLYSLYENLRGEVMKNVKSTDEDSSSSSNSDIEYYSPEELNAKSGESGSDVSKASDNDNQEAETPYKEYTLLKDKLTSTSEMKKSLDFDNLPESPELRFREEDSQRLAQISDLELQVEHLKCETGMMCKEKRQLEEKFESKSNEVVEMEEKISRLEAQLSESESKLDENELRLSSIPKRYEANEKQYVSRISDLVAKADNLQVEVNNLQQQKSKVEKNLLEHIDFLENGLASVKSQKDELELELKKKSEETSECLLQIETLRNELTSQTLNETNDQEVRVKNLELEICSLRNSKSNLEEQVEKINQEAFQSNVEKEELKRKVSELQTALSKKKTELSTEQDNLKAQIKSLMDKVKVLENKAERLNNELESLRNDKRRLETDLEKEKQDSLIKAQLEKKNNELTNKITDQQKTLLELGDEMSKLKDENKQAQGKFLDSKSNLQLVERKIEEMAEEFRQQFEAKHTILSRRIRVAEQLHVESKELCMKIKDKYEEENNDLKEKVENFKSGIKSVKEISLKANDVLTSLDSVSLKFEECTAHFMNRISKSSCELKFVKDWAIRKNKALLHVKDDLDCLFKQLDAKEAEILTFREKVWKSENKVRELEKMVKEKEDGMLGLQEEKREAIRQLCVWIDYHRSRSDYYKKMLSEMNPGRKRSS